MKTFEKFGDFWIAPEDISAVKIDYVYEYPSDNSSNVIVTQEKTDKVLEVAIFLKSGQVFAIKDEEAQQFAVYWKVVNQPIGDIA